MKRGFRKLWVFRGERDAQPGSRADLREKPRRPLTSTLGLTPINPIECRLNEQEFPTIPHVVLLTAHSIAQRTSDLEFSNDTQIHTRSLFYSASVGL